MVDFYQKWAKSWQNLAEVPRIFPKKKCHLFRKIATFFENFDPHFSEKLTVSARSPKKGHVPN